MFTKLFWKDTAERVIKTFAQTLAAVLLVGGTTILNVDWTQALAAAGTAALLSVLTSLASGVKTNTVDGVEPVQTASLLSGVTYNKGV